MQNKNIAPPSENNYKQRLEVLATPENIAVAADIFDRIVIDGKNNKLHEIAGGRTGVDAVNFLRTDPEVAEELLSYLRDKTSEAMLRYNHKLGERVMKAVSQESDAITKVCPVTKKSMSSPDYVTQLTARKLNGTFNVKWDTYVGEKGKSDGQHRQAAELVLQVLGYQEPEPPDPEMIAAMKRDKQLKQKEDAHKKYVNRLDGRMLSNRNKISHINNNPEEYKESYSQDFDVIMNNLNEVYSDIDEFYEKLNQEINGVKEEIRRERNKPINSREQSIKQERLVEGLYNHKEMLVKIQESLDDLSRRTIGTIHSANNVRRELHSLLNLLNNPKPYNKFIDLFK